MSSQYIKIFKYKSDVSCGRQNGFINSIYMPNFIHFIHLPRQLFLCLKGNNLHFSGSTKRICWSSVRKLKVTQAAGGDLEDIIPYSSYCCDHSWCSENGDDCHRYHDSERFLKSRNKAFAPLKAIYAKSTCQAPKVCHQCETIKKITYCNEMNSIYVWLTKLSIHWIGLGCIN